MSFNNCQNNTANRRQIRQISWLFDKIQWRDQQLRNHNLRTEAACLKKTASCYKSLYSYIY